MFTEGAGTGYQPPMGGGKSATKPRTQATPGGVYFAPPTGAISAAQDYAGANAAYQRALVRYNQQRTGLLKSYGYLGDVDSGTGMVKNLRVDAGNPYGQFQQMLRAQSQEDDTAKYSAEDRGLHGGLANQAVSNLKYAHGGESSNLAQSLFGNLSGIDADQLDAKGALDSTLWQLQQQAALQAIQNEDYNPADYGDYDGSDPGDYGGGGETATDAHDRRGGGAPAAAKPINRPFSFAKATKINTAATKKGQPISEHGLGSLGKPKPAAKAAPAKPASKAAEVAKKVVANSYTSGKKKRG